MSFDLGWLLCLFRDEINFDKEEVRPEGAVIAARITAENPDAGNPTLTLIPTLALKLTLTLTLTLGFQPTSGAIEELNFRSTPDVW